MSRRKRYSERTAKEIKQIAYRLLSEKGSAGLSIRAIAREIEMTPPALYTYFASLDDLITALIVDTFNAYADALETARNTAIENNASLTDQLIAVSLRYRTWAIEYAERWKLIYGNPIPGYHAPPEVTVPAVRRTGNVFLGIMINMVDTGELSTFNTVESIPSTVRKHLQATLPDDAPDTYLYPMYELYSCWTHLHGMITLEIFNHLQGAIGDAESFYLHEIKRMYTEMGLKV
ncbi:MAG: TetR/AcrR family transcriptional regulator [Chloroflexota bacterium]